MIIECDGCGHDVCEGESIRVLGERFEYFFCSLDCGLGFATQEAHMGMDMLNEVAKLVNERRM